MRKEGAVGKQDSAQLFGYLQGGHEVQLRRGGIEGVSVRQATGASGDCSGVVDAGRQEEGGISFRICDA